MENSFEAKRMRRLAALCGVSTPESDEALLDGAGTVLGMIIRAVESLYHLKDAHKMGLIQRLATAEYSNEAWGRQMAGINEERQKERTAWENDTRYYVEKARHEGRMEALNAVSQINGPSRAIARLKEKYAAEVPR